MNKLLGRGALRKGAVCSVTLVAAALMHPVVARAQAPVSVAVVVQTAQFEDQAQKDRIDTANDLKKILGSKKKTLRVVDTPAEAVVIIEVLGRAEQASADAKLERSALGQLEQNRYKAKVVRVKLSVGDYSTEIEGRYAEGPSVIYTTWAGAAVDAAGQIEKWIKTNRAKLPQ